MKRNLIAVCVIICLASSIPWLQTMAGTANGPAKRQTSGKADLPFRESGTKSSDFVQRKNRLARIAHDLLVREGKGLNPDFFQLDPTQRRAYVDTNRGNIPDLGMVRTYKKALKGVQIASTLYLPEKNLLAADTILIADHLVFSGSNATVKGEHNLFIYAREVQVGGPSAGKGSLTIDVSGTSSKQKENARLGSTPAEVAQTIIRSPGLGQTKFSSLLTQGATKSNYLRHSPSSLFVRTSVRPGGEDGDDGSDGENGAVGQAGSCTTGPAGNGGNGADGTAGNDGGLGDPGGDGADASSAYIEWSICGTPMDLYVTARGAAGQKGGKGGDGGNSGKGGNGGNGGDGTGVNAGNGGNGGDGADGGAGGEGGFGGNGGSGGDVLVYTDWCSWSEGSINIDTSGGAAGEGGDGGAAGNGGGAGNRGEGGSALTSGECPVMGSNGSFGTAGGGGTAGTAGMTGYYGNWGSDGWWGIWCVGC